MAERKTHTQLPKPASPPLPAAPCHRSPPRYPDFYGKHRKQLELQILNREIGFLQEELQSVDDLKPISRCCKEVDEFVGAAPDPMIPPNRKIHRPFHIWKCGKSSYNVSWLCCFRGCSLNLGKPSCACNPSKNCQRCCCYNSHFCSCLDKPSCSSCCDLPSLSCPDCSCSCVCSCPECRKVCHCPRCARNCCLSSSLCV